MELLIALGIVAAFVGSNTVSFIVGYARGRSNGDRERARLNG